MADSSFGPFDSTAFGEFLDGLVDKSEQMQQSTEHRLRIFVETMNDETLENMGWLMARIVEQPDLAHALRGVFTAEWWKRHPIEVPADGSAEG